MTPSARALRPHRCYVQRVPDDVPVPIPLVQHEHLYRAKCQTCSYIGEPSASHQAAFTDSLDHRSDP